MGYGGIRNPLRILKGCGSETLHPKLRAPHRSIPSEKKMSTRYRQRRTIGNLKSLIVILFLPSIMFVISCTSGKKYEPEDISTGDILKR
jgi:hypothetical protein